VVVNLPPESAPQQPLEVVQKTPEVSPKTAKDPKGAAKVPDAPTFAIGTNVEFVVDPQNLDAKLRPAYQSNSLKCVVINHVPGLLQVNEVKTPSTGVERTDYYVVNCRELETSTNFLLYWKLRKDVSPPPRGTYLQQIFKRDKEPAQV